MDWYEIKLREYIEKNRIGDPDKYVWFINNIGKTCKGYMTSREERNLIDGLMKSIYSIERTFGYPVWEFMQGGYLKPEFALSAEALEALPEKKAMEMFERSTAFKFGDDAPAVRILIEQSGESPVKYVKTQEYARVIDSAVTVLKIFSLAFDVSLEELALAGEAGISAVCESGMMADPAHAFDNCADEEIEKVFKDYVTYVMGRDPGIYLRIADLSPKVDIGRYLLDDGYKDVIDGIVEKAIDRGEEKGVSPYEFIIGVDGEIGFVESEEFYERDEPLCEEGKDVIS